MAIGRAGKETVDAVAAVPKLCAAMGTELVVALKHSQDQVERYEKTKAKFDSELAKLAAR